MSFSSDKKILTCVRYVGHWSGGNWEGAGTLYYNGTKQKKYVGQFKRFVSVEKQKIFYILETRCGDKVHYIQRTMMLCSKVS